MSRIFERAQKMLADNHQQHRVRLFAGALALVLVAAVSALLVGRASALAGGTTMQEALTKDTALFWAPQDGDESSWQKVDAEDPLDATSKLRLRLAFKLDAGALKSGATLQYKLPKSITLDTATAIKGDVLSGETVTEPASKNAVRIGTYSIENDVVTFTFDDDVVKKNEGD